MERQNSASSISGTNSDQSGDPLSGIMTAHSPGECLVCDIIRALAEALPGILRVIGE